MDKAASHDQIKGIKKYDNNFLKNRRKIKT